MENKIYFISDAQKEILISSSKENEKTFIAEINGKEIKFKEDYLEVVNKVFNFPIPSKGFDGYLDWIRDLDWLNCDSYMLIINNYANFMSGDIDMKKKNIEYFEKIILPWWQEEVERCVVEGKAKAFNVYLVD